MASHLLSALLLGLATAATPEGVVAQLALLSTRRGLSKGMAFAAGLATAVAAASIVPYVLSSSFGTTAVRGRSSSTYVALIAGSVLIVIGIWVWRQPAARIGGFAEKVLGKADRAPLWLVFALGTMGVNLVPGVALGTTLARGGLAAWQSVALLSVFLAVGTSCVTIPLLLSVIATQRWARWSDTLRGLALRRGNLVLGVVLVVVGAGFSVESVFAVLRLATGQP